MSEALEKWPIELFLTASAQNLPDCGGNQPQVPEPDLRPCIRATRRSCKKMSIIYDGQVKMAYMAIAASFSVNGVARPHTEILKNQELKRLL